MGEKRIIDHEGSNEIYNDDWFLKDSILHDTKKVQPSVIKEYVNQGMATATALANEATARANADTALGGRIDDEATARQNMDSQLASGISKQMSNLADFYDTTTSYVVGDVVMYQGGDLLRCIAPTSGAFDGTKWESVTVDELFDDLNFSADAISYDNTSSGLEAENVQDAIDEVVADVDAVETALETKAEQSGVYDDLVAGNLLSDGYTADNAPYLYRQSSSASSVEQNLIGASVAWNQLVKIKTESSTESGITITANGDGSYSMSGTASANVNYYLPLSSNFPKGHKFLAIGCPAGGNSTTYHLSIRVNNASTILGIETGNGLIVNNNTNYENGAVLIRASSGTAISGTIKFVPQFFDLTQMFGSTIADYIYSLEQATAGSGIAWLKANGFLTKDYYPYDSGSLQSVKTSGRKIVGKNICEGVNSFLISYSAQTGEATRITGTGTCLVVHVKEGYTYTFSNGENVNRRIVTYWDSTPNIGDSTSYAQSLTGNTFTAIKDGLVIIYIYNASVDTSVAQIELGSTATDYEPYTTHTYPTSPIDLRGLFKLENGNLVVDGDVYSADGSVKRKYGIVDLGSFNWVRNEYAQGGYAYFRSGSFSNWKNASYPNFLCTKYISATSRLAMNIDKSIAPYTDSNYNEIFIRDDSYSDATAFKTAMNGVYLVYELATPTSETADAYENPQLVGSTEEFIDTRDVPIPVGGERKYHTDLKAKLEELAKIPDVPSANGTYTLKATRSASGVTYAWVSD